MDNLPHHTNSLTSTTTSSTIITTTTTTQWDLAAIASMDADHHLLHHHHHHEILHDHPNQALFPFASLPTWSNYSSVPLPPLPSSSSSFMSRQLETLVEGEEKEKQLVEEEQEQEEEEEEEEEELGAMKEMMYKIAAMQPVEIDPATIRKPKRRNVRISDDPQSVAARLRRERISEKIRILQRLVPGGTKLDTASMLEEAVRYVKFLKRQIRHLQQHPAPPLLAPPTTTTAAATRVTAAGDIGGELPLCFSFNEG